MEDHDLRPKLKCALNCGDSSLFAGHEGVIAHFEQDCAKIMLKCDTCDKRVVRAKSSLHECDLNSVIKMQREALMEKDARLKKL